MLHSGWCVRDTCAGQRVKLRTVVHDALFLRNMLHGGDGIRPVIILPYGHAAKQALAQVRQFQPPHAVRRHAIG